MLGGRIEQIKVEQTFGMRVYFCTGLLTLVYPTAVFGSEAIGLEEAAAAQDSCRELC